jgi:RnfABCDGE-type electron transport complex G subunit
MLLLGGVYLMGRRVISCRIPASYLGSVALLTFLFAPAGVSRVDWMLAQLFSGGLILGAFFMATDPTTSPVTPRGHVMFGVGCGILTVVLRSFSSYPEGVGWAILTMNACAWLLDKVGMPRRYGAPRFSTVRSWMDKIRRSMSAVRIVKPDLKLNFTDDGRAPGEAQLDALRVWAKNAAWVGGSVVVMGVMIFGVHRATDLHAAQADNEAQQELLAHVMPAAAFISESPYRVNDALSIQSGFNRDNEQIGYCVEVQAQGFGGLMTMLVGVDLDGKVTGLAVIDHKETFSVAEKALSESFALRYAGKSGTIQYSGRNSVEAVSGATATSRAITDGVNRALAIVAGLGEEHMLEFEENENE